MREIPLAQGKVALVDDTDYEWLMQWKWTAKESKQVFGVIWYAKRRLPDNTTLSMHTALTGFKMTDHWDGNGLNNQRSNLRRCTGSQNNANRRKTSGCSSIYKGVTWFKPARLWMAQITVNYENKCLGYFKDERLAAQAYNAAALHHFGEFARINPV